MKTYSFKYLCGQCREMFMGSCNIPTDKDFTGFIHGFLCDNCYHQTKLKLEDYS